MTSIVSVYSIFSTVAFMLARGYAQEVEFAGAELVTVDLTENKVAAENSRITFRLKTISPFGLILYSRGTQGDYILIEIVQGSLRYEVDLGSTSGHKVSSKQQLLVGKNLDNNQWHSIDINRVRNNVNITIDGKTSKSVPDGRNHFTRLDLDDTLYVGGLLKNTHIEKSLKIVAKNFIGCLGNFLFGKRNILYDVKYNAKNYLAHGDIKYKCKTLQYVPITFPNPKSVIRIPTFVTQSLSLKLSFRSYVGDGLLLSKLSKNGKIFIEIRKGRLVIRVEAPKISPVTLTTGNALNDGNWHAIDCLVNSEQIALELDKEKILRYRTPSLKGVTYVAAYATLGGGDDQVLTGFQGCVYRIKIDGTYVDARILPAEDKTDVLENNCSIMDMCWPNPCHNGGLCRQMSKRFECDCTRTLYNGRTCQVPIVQKTCQEYRSKGLKADSYCKIDPDGTGPMDSFEVLCNMTRGEDAMTVIPAKNNMKRLKVEQISIFGNDKYYQHIDYDLPASQIRAIVQSSSHCRQFVRYECKNSLLLNSPRGPSHVRWVNREGIFEDYWGGAPKGSYKCSCGVTKTCSDATKYCNCDRGDNFWREDSGFLTDKDSLPIKLIQFDAKTASSYFAVGNLECWSKNTTTPVPSTPVPTNTAVLRACRRVHMKATTTTKSPTTVEAKLPQTETMLKSKRPRKFLEISSPSFTELVKSLPKVVENENPKKSGTNHSMNVTNDPEKPHDGVTISMSILAVIVISASIVVVWAIIAVIVIVRRKRQNVNSSSNQEHETEDATEMCIFFRQSKREIVRPTIELQRDSYDSSPEPPSTLDYTEYTGFRQPITTHITLDYAKSKKNKSAYFC